MICFPRLKENVRTGAFVGDASRYFIVCPELCSSPLIKYIKEEDA